MALQNVKTDINVSNCELYVYSEFTPECMHGDGSSILYIGRIKPVCSDNKFVSDNESDYLSDPDLVPYIDSEEKILPSQKLLINMISNKTISCCGGFNRYTLLVIDENTDKKKIEKFEIVNEYYLEERSEYTYLELLKLLGDNEIVEID